MKLKFKAFELTVLIRSTYCKERGVLDDDAPWAACWADYLGHFMAFWSFSSWLILFFSSEITRSSGISSLLDTGGQMTVDCSLRKLAKVKVFVKFLLPQAGAGLGWLDTSKSPLQLKLKVETPGEMLLLCWRTVDGHQNHPRLVISDGGKPMALGDPIVEKRRCVACGDCSCWLSHIAKWLDQTWGQWHRGGPFCWDVYRIWTSCSSLPSLSEIHQLKWREMGCLCFYSFWSGSLISASSTNYFYVAACQNTILFLLASTLTVCNGDQGIAMIWHVYVVQNEWGKRGN